MPLIDRTGRGIPDHWQLLAEDASLPPSGPVVLPLQRWLAERDRLRLRGELNGVFLRSDESVADIEKDVRFIDLIILEFPKFTDGRPYSAARLLRERYGYVGELRGVGEILRDQLGFLRRCGFDSFALKRSGELGEELFDEISPVYQTAADAKPRAADIRSAERTGYEQSQVCAGFWAY